MASDRLLDPGSSPLTRGKRDSLSSAMIVLRLIPAHAGKTRDCLRRHSRGPAHPRSRGENTAGGLDRPEADGSSPLTRGKLTRQPRRLPSCGLIPAHAGKTHMYLPPGPGYPAHPRSRGENALPLGGATTPNGSSPLTRGKHHDVGWNGLVFGLIPAHAGKTSGGLPRRARTRAHPRSRGENAASDRLRARL